MRQSLDGAPDEGYRRVMGDDRPIRVSGRVVRPLAATCLAVLTAVLAGCPPEQAGQPRPVSVGPKVPGPESDPCAERLDALCGRLMLYVAANRELPAELADLDKGTSRPARQSDAVASPASAPAALVCPTSGKPYIYDPDGVEVVGWQGRMIVYDSTPCHWSMRWGILIEPSSPGKPIVLRVIHPPERAIKWPEGVPPGP